MYQEEIRKARKPHRCEGCGQRVEPGDTYLHIVGHNCDGDFGSADYHTDCRALETELNRINGLREDDWMSLADHVEEGGQCVLEGAPPAVVARFPEPV